MHGVTIKFAYVDVCLVQRYWCRYTNWMKSYHHYIKIRNLTGTEHVKNHIL